MNGKEKRKLIRSVAKKHGKSVAEVKAEIEKVITSAYVFPNKKALSVPRKGEIPTLDELLDHLVSEFEKDNIEIP